MNENDHYSGFAKVYDYFLNLNADYKKYIKKLFHSIQKRYPDLKNAILADVGGGTGYVSFQIHDQVKKIKMIEPSEAMLNVAKSKLNPDNHANIELRQAAFPLAD